MSWIILTFLFHYSVQLYFSKSFHGHQFLFRMCPSNFFDMFMFVYKTPIDIANVAFDLYGAHCTMVLNLVLKLKSWINNYLFPVIRCLRFLAIKIVVRKARLNTFKVKTIKFFCFQDLCHCEVKYPHPISN